MVSRKGYTQKKRRGRYRQTKQILLLAVEGKNKTESNYFQSIASPYVDVRIVRGNETDPVGMAKRMLYEYEGILQDSDYRKRRKTPPFRAGDIRRVRRICVSN